MKSHKVTSAADASSTKTDNGPVSVRVRPNHLAKLDAYAASKGISRAAAIQIAIAELIERNALK